MNRRTKRTLALLGMFSFAGWMIYEGFQGMIFASSEMPVHYAGYIVAVMGVLGMCGVNIWRGGPLDPRNDP